MTSRWTNVQAMLVATVMIVLLAVGDNGLAWFALLASGLLAASFLVLNHAYARNLAERPRSHRRATEDRSVTKGLLVMAITVTLLALLSFVLRQLLGAALPTPLVAFGSISGFAVAVIAAGFSSIYLSSLIDRFLITPWTRGTLGVLPFEDGRRQREDLTRIWLWHRIVCTAVFFVGIWAVCGLAYFSGVQAAGSSSWVLYLLGLFSPSIIPAVIMQGWLGGLPSAVNLGFGHIDICVGDYIERKRGGVILSGVIAEASVDKALTVVAKDGDVWILPLKEARPNDDVHRMPLPEDVDWRKALQLADLDLDDFSTQKTVPTRPHFAF